MTTVTAGLDRWTWSPEVLQFARDHGVAEYLDPMMEATRELFPTAREIRVMVETDPELAGVQAIVWEVDVLQADVGNYQDRNKQWMRAFMTICPKTLGHLFVQTLIPVK